MTEIIIICKEDTRQKSFISDKKILLKSPYFRAIFEGNFRESHETTITINYEIELFQYYFNYLNINFYGGEYFIKNVNMINIFDFFSDDAAIEYCIDLYKDQVKKAISQKKYNELADIAYIDLKEIEMSDLINIFKLDNEILMKIINNINDLECETTIDYWSPIHYICQYSTPEMIKYIIDKGVNLECETRYRWRPIHFICQYSTPEMIKYIIDKNVDLECCNCGKWRPIHYICRYSTPEMIKYIIDKGVNLECETDEKWQPIHLICRYSTSEMIKYIIDKKC